MYRHTRPTITECLSSGHKHHRTPTALVWFFVFADADEGHANSISCSNHVALGLPPPVVIRYKT